MQLQGPIYVAGLGSITQQELVPTNGRSGKFQSLTMELTPDGYIEVVANEGKVKFGFPTANCQCWVFAKA